MKATLVDHMGTDTSVVNSARVSFAKEASQYTNEENERLIKYLAKHKHYSPFGHCFATVHVKAPIFVARQLVKHEYLRMNEISRRYVDTTPEFYIPKVWRGKSVNKKQGSSGTVDIGIPDWRLYEEPLRCYEYLLDQDVAPEQARMVLPLSMYTEWYWSGSMDAFANMCNLRCKDDTQEETREIAQQISSLLEPLWPISWKELRT